MELATNLSQDVKEILSSPLKSSTIFNNMIASPLSNLKLLTEVACAEYEYESQNQCTSLSQQSSSSSSTYDEVASPCIDESSPNLEDHGVRLDFRNASSAQPRRGEKLTDICARFLQMLPLTNLPKEQRPLIEMSALEKILGVERRRLYDIMNILESLSIVEKCQKNCLRWNGTAKLVHTLQRLRSLSSSQFTLDDLCYIMDDLIYRKIYIETGTGTTSTSASQPVTDVDSGFEEFFCACMRENCGDSCCRNYNEDDWKNEVREHVESAVTDEPNQRSNPCSVSFSPDKADRPLGIISQRFLILLLLQKHPRALSMHSAIKLMKLDLLRQIERDGIFRSSGETLAEKVAEMDAKKLGLMKTRSRRLYDVCNVLTALGIIKRARLIRFEMDCVSGFVYCGPDPDGPSGVTPSPLVSSRQSLLADKSPEKEALRERKRGNFVRHLSLDDLCSPERTKRPKPSILRKMLTPSTPPASVDIVPSFESFAVPNAPAPSFKRHRSDNSLLVMPSHSPKIKVVYVRPEDPLYASFVSGNRVHVLSNAQFHEEVDKVQNVAGSSE